MPSSPRGQLISFAVEKDADQRFEKWKRIDVKAGETIARITARYGQPEDAQDVVKKNGVRGGANYVLKIKKPVKRKGESKKAYGKRVGKWAKRQRLTKLWVPGNFDTDDVVHVLAGDTPPSIGKGYAKFDTVSRPERVGLIRFQGYDPTELRIPIRFESDRVFDARGGSKESLHDGQPESHSIEDDCARLERFAGRGVFKGAAVGPPPILTISTTGGSDNASLPLIPLAYQVVDKKNETGPRWRIVDIEWDDQSALRNKHGNRIRQLATVVLWEHVGLKLNSRSVTRRAKTRKKPPGKPRRNGTRTRKGGGSQGNGRR